MKKILLFLSLCAILFPVSSFAAYFKAGNVFASPSGTIRDNVYVVGGNVAISSAIDGDLFAAGSMLFISGKVKQDITLAGGTIIVSGASGEDIRVGGGNVTIGGNFSGELMLAGGQVIITPDTQIKKDSYIAAGALTFSGKEAGNLSVSAGGEVYINGIIEKNLTIKAAKKVTIGSGAVIKGNLEYSALSEASIEGGAQILGITTFHKIEKTGSAKSSKVALGFLIGLFALSSLIKLLLILTATYLLWYIWKKDSGDIIRLAKSHFGKSLFRGFVFMVVMPVTVIISLVTVIGILPGLFGLLLYAAILILSVPVAALFASSLLMNRADLKWFHILLGAIAIIVADIIPFVGWIAVFIVYLAALGALLSVLRPKFQRSV